MRHRPIFDCRDDMRHARMSEWQQEVGGGTWFEALCHSLAPGCDLGDAELANADWALLKMHGTGTKSA